MSKVRILYVSQEINPFLPESEISHISRHLPQAIHEKGKEIRVFMPRYGKINERRHQLHEVIRLSGMNLIINDTDHPLIIKVASIPSARMQVYFIDNEEYFKRKSVLVDEKGKLHADSDERSIFFVRGVLEAVKKLGWTPDVIHCHGWMTSLLPLYVKEMYNEDPHFADTKVVYSAYNKGFEGSLNAKMSDKVAFDGINKDSLAVISDPTFENLNKLAIAHSDAVVLSGESVSDELRAWSTSKDIPTLEHKNVATIANEMSAFYDSVVEGKPILIEE